MLIKSASLLSAPASGWKNCCRNCISCCNCDAETRHQGRSHTNGELIRSSINSQITMFIVLLLFTSTCAAMSDEKRLIKHLLMDYEMMGVVGRPVYNISQTVHVQYGLALIQILDLDEKNQILTTNVWCRYVWQDILLTWNPDEYGGVDHVRVPIAKIWSPDIVLYNYADQRLKEHREAMAVVSSDGTVLWIPPAIFRSACSIDITHFPFDIQTCRLKFGSWTYDGFKLDIDFYNNESSVDISDYVVSNEWALLAYPAKKNVKYYSCCQEPYPDLTFSVTLKRIAVFYNYILILPCVLLSFLTLVIFWLPPESPAKMMLGMNVFVAFFVLLLLLADNTPPAASSIPLIGAYFCMNMILITLSTFLAIIVINTHIRGDRKNKVPLWLKKITVDGLARVLCMSEFLDSPVQKSLQKGQQVRLQQMIQQPVQLEQPTQLQQPLKMQDDYVNETTSLTANIRKQSTNGATIIVTQSPTNKRPNILHIVNNELLPQNTAGAENEIALHDVSASASTAAEVGPGSPVTSSPCPSNGQPCDGLEKDVNDIRNMLKTYMTRLSEKDTQAKVVKEWRIVARVFDRLFFFAYCSTIVISLATIFPKSRE